MITKNEIIQNLYTSTEMADCIRKMTPELDQQDELRQNLFEALLSYPDEKILALHESGVLKYYAIRILLNLNSRANPVNKKNRIGEHQSLELPIKLVFLPEDKDLHQRQDKVLKDIHLELDFIKNENGRGFLCSVVFQEYVNLGSVRKAAAAIGIPAKSVWNAVNEVRTRLKTKFHAHSDLV